MIHKKEFRFNVLFTVYLLIIIGTRLFIYFNYNLKIIDTNQPYMWLGAVDYAERWFHEPRYYGQDYNTFMEGFLSVPLLYLNIPVYAALPVITNILSLCPFLIIAFTLYFKNQKAYAIGVLSILVCMPVQYDLLNSLPRGFVTGLFFTSFYILSIINPQNLFLIFLNTALSVLAYFINPNSMIISLPFIFYLFTIHFQNRTYYYVTGTALLLAYPTDLFFNVFYRLHPDYVMQSTFNTFSLEYFVKSLCNLNERFQHINFFVPHQSFVLIAVIVFMAIMLYRQNKRAFLALMLMVVIILLSFFASIVSDGNEWVFMSYSRMFLGIPIMIALFLPQIKFEYKKISHVLMFLPLIFSIYKFSILKEELDKEDNRKIAQGVRVLSLESCFEITNFYKKKCEENNCHFIMVSTTYWLNTVVNIAGPALDNKYPETQETRFEKRYWVRNQNKNRLLKRFIFLSSEFDLDKILPTYQKFSLQRLDNFGLFLVDNNQLPLGDFISNINTIEPGLND